jgi:hypothetical protein
MCHPVVLGPRHIAYGLAACVAAAAAEVVVDEEVVLLDVLLLAVVVGIVVVGVGGEDADVGRCRRRRSGAGRPVTRRGRYVRLVRRTGPLVRSVSLRVRTLRGPDEPRRTDGSPTWAEQRDRDGGRGYRAREARRGECDPAGSRSETTIEVASNGP